MLQVINWCKNLEELSKHLCYKLYHCMEAYNNCSNRQQWATQLECLYAVFLGVYFTNYNFPLKGVLHP